MYMYIYIPLWGRKIITLIRESLPEHLGEGSASLILVRQISRINKTPAVANSIRV